MEETPTPHQQDTTIPTKDHHEVMDNFINVEYENHTTLKTLTREFNNLWHRVETAKGQPREAINHLECELPQIVPSIHSSAPLEPLDEVLQQYTETICTAQKQTTFANTLIQDIPNHSGSDI